MSGRILRGGSVDIVESTENHEIARIEIELTDGRKMKAYFPVVEDDDNIEALELTDTQIEARESVHRRRRR